MLQSIESFSAGVHVADKMKSSSGDLMTGAAEVVGGALGTIAGTVDRLRADHPHPVEEAKEALAAGQQQIAQVAAGASSRANAVIKATKAVITKVRKRAASVRKRAAQPRRTGSKIATKARLRGKKVVKQTKRAAKKTVKRGKKTVARAKKSAARRIGVRR